MSKLEDFTEEELINELEKRKLNKTRPQLKKDNIDLSGVISQAEHIINSVVNDTYYEENDNPQFIYEAVMTALYGDDFFEWFNKNTP